MASVKVKFRSSAVDGNVGAVYYQIIHDRKVRRLPTDYRIYPSEWSDSKFDGSYDHEVGAISRSHFNQGKYQS